MTEITKNTDNLNTKIVQNQQKSPSTNGKPEDIMAKNIDDTLKKYNEDIALMKNELKRQIDENHNIK